MGDESAAVATLDAAIDGLLTGNKNAIVAALADDGFRIPLPDSFELGEHQALPVPADRATMLDVVVPADRMSVVALWERARKNGIGVGSVHVLGEEERRLALSIVDTRHRYGVYLAVLTDDGVEGEAGPELLAGPLVVPSRPRMATAHKSMTAQITAVDENVTKMLGWATEQMIGLRSSEFIHPEDHDRAVAGWMELIAHPGSSQRIRLRHRCQDGSWLWVETEHIHNGAEDPDEVDVTAYITDISDEMAAHEALHRREQLFSRLAESLPTGVLQLQQGGAVVYSNARLAVILGIEHPGTAADVLATIAEDDRPGADAALKTALEDGADGELEVEILRRGPAGDERRRCALTFAAVSDQEGQPGALICVSDVTESARMREELKMQATYDALTSCLNRASVMHALEGFLTHPDGRDTAVIFVDIDNFKPVNDRLGHAAGDELLVHVAERLRGLSREADVVGRLGGDEFLLVCRGLELAEQAANIAIRVADVLNGPVALAAGTVELQASIGVACAEPGTTCDAVVARADAAMYESKRQRKGRPVLYDEALEPAPRSQDEAA